MDESKWLRYAGFAGIAFVLLTVVGAFLPGAPPSPNAAVGEWKSFYSDHRSAVIVGVYLQGLGAALVLWFGSALRALLHRAEGGSGTLSWTSFAGVVATVSASLVGLLITGTLALHPQRSDEATRLLVDLGNLDFPAVYFVWAVFAAAAGAVMVATGLFARWLGWAGVALGMLLLVSAAGLGATSGPLAAGGAIAIFAFLLGMIWTLAVSIFLLRTRSAAPSPTT